VVAVLLAVLLSIAGCSPDAGNADENWTKYMSQATQAWHQNNYPQAENLLNAAIKEAEHGDNLLWQPESWALLGDVQVSGHKLVDAEASYRRALALYENILAQKAGDALQRRSVLRTHAELLGKIADVIAGEGKLKEAETDYSQALEEGKKCFISLDVQNKITGRYAKLLKALNKSNEAAQLESEIVANEGVKTAQSELEEGEKLFDKCDDNAKVKFLTARTIARQHQQRQEETSALLLLAQTEVCDGDQEQAQRYAQEAKVIARQSGEKEQICDSLTILSIVKEARGERQAAAQLLQEAQKINANFCAIVFSSIACHHLGKLHYDRAVPFFKHAIEMLDRSDHPWNGGALARLDWRNQNLAALGNCYHEIHDYDAAQKVYAELLSNSKNAPPSERAKILDLQATNYYDGEKVSESLTALQQEMALIKANNSSKEALAPVLNCMASCYLALKRPKEAESCWRDAIASTSNEMQRAIYQRHLAATYFDEQKYPEASAMYQNLLPLVDKAPAQVRVTLLKEIGAAFRKAHRYAEAEKVEQSIRQQAD